MLLNMLNDLAEATKASDGKKNLNQYSLSNMNERCGDLVSRTCLAGARSATSHSARNSMTLFSSLGGRFGPLGTLTPYSAFAKQGVCLLYVGCNRQQKRGGTFWRPTGWRYPC